MQRRKLMDFTFTKAMMKSNKANPIKFESKFYSLPKGRIMKLNGLKMSVK